MSAPAVRAFAAVDLGATSGRVVIGRVGGSAASGAALSLELVRRFANGPVETPEGLRWDFAGLYRNIVEGLAEAVQREPGIESVGIDSWAVDYGLIRDGALLNQPFHYRDDRCQAGVEKVHATVPFAELYERNGLQFLPFNTLYQWSVDAGVQQADAALLIPDLVAYLLTGVARAERTNASSTGLVRVGDRAWDTELADRLGIPTRMLPPLIDAGTTIGTITGAALEQIGVPLPVVAVGSHDTASAVVGTPLSTPDAAYISCGTWGLVGLEITDPVVTDAAREANFTHELGVDDRIRFLHNVTGLWLLTQTLQAWEADDGAPIDLPALLRDAAAVVAEVPLFNANDAALSAPGDMPARIAAVVRAAGAEPPQSRAGFVRMIVESIADAFAAAVQQAAQLTGRPVDVIHVVGGGSLNAVLCQATASRAQLPVVAGPVEATALGNIMVQARAAGCLGPHATLEEVRALISSTHETVRYLPE
ncbi:rhamnulokinase [Microbacterium sp. YY-01]|uniref:rhamnulokinase n=1 Tax=Microbacterium sp. YY-01 TaxID=3421634 RepID=UPI003D16E984